MEARFPGLGMGVALDIDPQVATGEDEVGLRWEPKSPDPDPGYLWGIIIGREQP